MKSMSRPIKFAAVMSLALSTLSSVAAEDYFLTIGGGYSPQGNQISIERNVLFFQRLLSEQKPQGAPHDIYFADGDSPQRDVQYAGSPNEVPEANRLAAELFTGTKYLGLKYRDHSVEGVKGAATRANVEQWFAEVGGKLQPGDRLILYVTAHGGRGKDKKQPYNTKLKLWNEEEISVGELAGLLNKLPEGVPVVAVMVQCFAGGFAHLIFEGGDSTKGLSSRPRGGFFATTHDRGAAGCTPDIDEENYHEYSTFFWAAIGGRTRTGEAIDPPDYDGDGQVSFEEAHYFTMLASDTIDISQTTSDALLETHSKLSEKGRDDLLAPTAAFATILAAASPAQRAALSGLAEQLKLEGDAVFEAAKREAERAENERKNLAGQIDQKKKQYNEKKKNIQNALVARVPELANLFNPQSLALVTERADQFVEVVKAQPAYSDFHQLSGEIRALEEQRLELERRWVKCQRLMHTARHVALAANLEKLASPLVVQRYREIRALEAGSLGRVRGNTVETE